MGMAKPNIVMGIADGYTHEDLSPFVLSLHRSGFQGEILIFHHRLTNATLDKLRRLNVRLLPFFNLRSRFRGRISAGTLNRLSQAYYRWKWPLYSWAWPYLLSPTKQRFLLYHRFLESYGHQYNKVLLVDTRDVYFQRDPFSEDSKGDIVFFEESHSLRHGMFNPMWILFQLGPDVLKRLGDRMALCSGTILGRAEAVKSYLGHLLQVMKGADRLDFATGDQALHNFAVYEGLDSFPFEVRRCANGADLVYTLSRYINASHIQQSTLGEVVDENGRVIPILHQYDRHPGIHQAMLRLLAT
jgi:hypothetical protein